MYRINEEIRAFMLREGDPDRALRSLLMTMHIFSYWDNAHGSPVTRFISDRELELRTMRAAGVDIVGR